MTDFFHLASCFEGSSTQEFIPFYGRIIVYCIDIPCSFTYSFADGHLGCFHFLPTVNHVAVFVLVPAFISFGYIFRNEIARSHANFAF